MVSNSEVNRRNAAESNRITGEEIKKEGNRKQSGATKDAYLSIPCHRTCESILNERSADTSYKGFFNLAIVLLYLSFGKMALANVIEYGMLCRLSFIKDFFSGPREMPAMWLFVILIFVVSVTYAVEKLMVLRYIPIFIGTSLHIVNLFLIFCLPIFFTRYYSVVFPLPYFVVSFLYVISLLKCWSYVHVNFYYRKQPSQSRYGSEIEKSKLKWPENITFGNFVYYMFAPTFCYELTYPQSRRMSIKFICLRIFETLLCISFQLFITQQWIIPAVKKSEKPIVNSDWPEIIERMLTLAIPNNISWLLFFYITFHALPNAIAEVMHFGDREFYLDWWNSKDIDSFWRKWNMPIHKFCKRHIYKPLLSRGVPAYLAGSVVFFTSAVFHEYLISVPLGILRFWSFLGMFMQIPLSYIVKCFSGDRGNKAVWISLIIGQPMIFMLYLNDFIIMNREKLLL